MFNESRSPRYRGISICFAWTRRSSRKFSVTRNGKDDAHPYRYWCRFFFLPVIFRSLEHFLHVSCIPLYKGEKIAQCPPKSNDEIGLKRVGLKIRLLLTNADRQYTRVKCRNIQTVVYVAHILTTSFVRTCGDDEG